MGRNDLAVLYTFLSCDGSEVNTKSSECAIYSWIYETYFIKSLRKEVMHINISIKP